MSHKEDGDEIARALVQKRWAKAGEKQRSEHARMMARARWAGHVPKGGKTKAKRRRKKAGDKGKK